jgi:hypothetical protein
MGSGFKTFTQGEVLTASDVNNFLMEQSVMSFPDAGTRGSAIVTPEEGMLTYLQDTNRYEFYDGADYTNLSNAFNNGFELISTTTISSGAASVNVDNVFSADFNVYKIITRSFAQLVFGGTAIPTFNLRAGGVTETGSFYNRQTAQISDTTLSAARTTNAPTWEFLSTANRQTQFEITLFLPFSEVRTRASVLGALGVTDPAVVSLSLVQTLDASYDGFNYGQVNGLFSSGSISVYGLKET